MPIAAAAVSRSTMGGPLRSSLIVGAFILCSSWLKLHGQVQGKGLWG
jgi:hypothetical protein